jgi:hypothetical protein
MEPRLIFLSSVIVRPLCFYNSYKKVNGFAGRILAVQPSLLTSSIYQGITVFGVGFRAGNMIACNIAGPSGDFTGSSLSLTTLATAGSSSYQEFSVPSW